MLIGYWETIPSNNPYLNEKTVAQVKHISFLTRSDKRKDRIEIAPESLHLAALEAEVELRKAYSKKAGSPMMVIGWYHSHPHITIFPSHVDIRTQLSQQLMDKRFFGIIVSCFDNNNDHTEKVQITCFQSEDDTPLKRVNVPLMIQPSSNDCRELYLKLPEHMCEEYKKEYAISNERIQYDLRSSKNVNTASLPHTMTQLYNTSVYGQLVTSLIDSMIVPQTHLLDLKAAELDKQIKELKAYRQQLLSEDNLSTHKPNRKMEDYLIHL